MKKMYLLLIAFAFGLNAEAYHCKVDGICYNLDTYNHTATVTYSGYPNNNEYTGYYSSSEKLVGDIHIPSKISYNDVEYTVTAIGNNAFYTASGTIPITSIIIPSTVTSIGNSAFSGLSSLISVTIPNSVTSIGRYAFLRCSGLTSVTIPNSVMSIGEAAFSECSYLNYVTIEEGVASIGSYSFSDCVRLISVNIPASVTNIDNYAFQNCISLASVMQKNETPFSLGTNAFNSISNDCVLYIPYGNKDAYIASGWTEEIFKGGIVDEVPVTITGAKYATFVSINDIDFSGIDGLYAYTASLESSILTFNRITGPVKAGEGLLLYADVAENTSFYIPITSSNPEAVSGNKLVRGEGVAVASTDDGGATYNYVLSNNGGEVNFYRAAGKTVGTNKAYLKNIPAGVAGAKFFLPTGEDETDGIRSIENSELRIENSNYYNLSGQRVGKDYKGIVIVNGKKMLNK